MAKPKPAFRLAFRVEGNNWVAYLAKMDTLDGATYLGSIAMPLVENIERMEAFKKLMTDCMTDMVKLLYGVTPEWKTRRAPPGEKSGNA